MALAPKDTEAAYRQLVSQLKAQGYRMTVEYPTAAPGGHLFARGIKGARMVEIDTFNGVVSVTESPAP